MTAKRKDPAPKPDPKPVPAPEALAPGKPRRGDDRRKRFQAK